MIFKPAFLTRKLLPLAESAFQVFRSRNSLPIFNIDKEIIQENYARIRPFLNPDDKLEFSSWRLAHAVKKAECACWPLIKNRLVGALGFFLENSHVIDWGSKSFSLQRGMARYYSDFSSTSLSGRIAQGLTLLTFEEMGYSYVGRFETIKKTLPIQDQERLDQYGNETPDFIVEKLNEWVLLESKGGFVLPRSKPNFKIPLRKALKQLDCWDKSIEKQPKKSFAVGSFLRESDDNTDESSMVLLVDPEAGRPEDPVHFPVDSVRRANFASWLSLMGFFDAAQRIRSNLGEPKRIQVPTISLFGRKFVIEMVATIQIMPDIDSDFSFKKAILDKMTGRNISTQIIGLDFDIISLLGASNADELMSNIMQISPSENYDTSVEMQEGIFYGSIFSDGSLMGDIRSESINGLLSEIKIEDIQL